MQEVIKKINLNWLGILLATLVLAFWHSIFNLTDLPTQVINRFFWVLYFIIIFNIVKILITPVLYLLEHIIVKWWSK